MEDSQSHSASTNGKILPSESGCAKSHLKRSAEREREQDPETIRLCELLGGLDSCNVRVFTPPRGVLSPENDIS